MIHGLTTVRTASIALLDRLSRTIQQHPKRITAAVDGSAHLQAKVAAILAHATQMTLGPTGRAFTLSNKVVLPVLAHEHYILAAGEPGPLDERGWERDLLAGVEVTD